MFEKGLHTPKDEIFTTDTGNTSKIVGFCISGQSLDHLPQLLNGSWKQTKTIPTIINLWQGCTKKAHVKTYPETYSTERMVQHE